MSELLVSVVIPTYNHAQFVGEAVDSVLAQTYRPIEVIVVDDGSTDSTADVLASYADKIQYIHQENRGLSAARNAGIARAKGEWIALLDADDLWSPDKIQLQIDAAARHPEFTLIGGQDGHYGSFPAVQGTTSIREFTVRDFLTTTPFGPSAALIHRELIKVIGGFDEQLSPVADRDYWLRAAACSRVGRLEWPCWHYRISAGQMSRNADYMHHSLVRLMRKFFTEHPSWLAYRQMALGFLFRDAAWTYYAQGDRLKALGCLCKSVAHYPRRIPHSRPFNRLKLALRFLKGGYREVGQTSSMQS